MAAHPIHDAVPHAVPIVGNGILVESPPPVTHEHLGEVPPALRVHVDLVGLCVLGGVHHRLAGREDQRTEPLGNRGVTDGDHLDRYPMGILDLGRGGLERAGHGRVGRWLVAVQPGPQVALLRSSERGDRPAVAGVLLNEREGLQHRVVQVRRHVGALL